MNKLKNIIIFISLTLPYSVVLIPLILLSQDLNLGESIMPNIYIFKEYKIFFYFLLMSFFFSYVYLLRTFKKRYKFQKIYYFYYCLFVLNYISLPFYLDNNYLIFFVNLVSTIVIYFSRDLFKITIIISFIYMFFFWFFFKDFHSLIFSDLIISFFSAFLQETNRVPIKKIVNKYVFFIR